MNNVIIFSHYDLIRFFLELVINKVTEMHPKGCNPSITICNSLSEFESAIQEIHQPVVIFDIDNVSRDDQFRLLTLINNKEKRDRIVVFTKETEESKFFVEVRDVVSFVSSKTATQGQLVNILYPLMNGCDATFSMKVQTEVINKQEKVYLTPRENQICKYILLGHSNTDIAHILDISPKTISVHRLNIYSKNQVKELLGLYSKLKNRCIN
ncbi:TPA: response regulator transcription factor [Yersinia enterocolitica]|nr:response regulator transcription factor [Yersinia enterocolitica]HEN3611056.1 response regulator transcription factor [Yersinia enterocolitica]HEN3623367.1 response regulator transcription factor [Yersinia enterocolitica]HEO0719637.1 response regulator transcription factor [Yersinia enterocolitica]